MQKNYHLDLDAKEYKPCISKKKKQYQNKSLRAQAGKPQADIRHMGRDSLSVIGGLWCLFPADSHGD